MTDFSYFSDKATILVVDDTHDNLTFLSHLLNTTYNVNVANSGEKALKIIQSASPDLILLDIMMPYMDGYEVCRQLKANHKTKKIPIIFMIEKSTIDDEIYGLSIGAVDYIIKPINPAILLSRVSIHIKVKRMQDSLKDQRAWFHSIIESAPDAMLVTDEKGNIILCNSRAAEIFNYDSRELHSLNIKQLVVDDKGICKDGRHFPADVSVNDLPNLNNGGVCHCVLVRDITKRMRIENDIRHAKKLAETANQMKSDFLANMSHELRTPLNAIIGYSEILQEDAEDIGQPEFVLDLKRIHGAGKHLLKLINDILDLSKIEAGKMDIYLEEVNLENVISETRDIVLPLMVKNNNQFVIENALCFKKMYTDVTKVKQTLFNLIGNAAKFTHNGVITLSIKDYLLDDKEHVSFSVHDTGIGLTAEQMEKLFTDFVQADTSTTRKYGGSGLGLAISRRFCQMLGGDIIVNSAINKGSTFTIDLPMNIQQNQPSNLRSKIDE